MYKNWTLFVNVLDMYYTGLILQVTLFVIRFGIQTEAQGLLSICVVTSLSSFVEEKRCEKFSQLKTSDSPETIQLAIGLHQYLIHQVRLQFLSIGLHDCHSKSNRSGRKYISMEYNIHLFEM